MLPRTFFSFLHSVDMLIGFWDHSDGGWLQFGTPNMYDLCALLGETPCQCVVVCPAYRLNMFGFLACRELKEEAEASGEPFGNYGFWDQRLALEWTHKNICYFGGDAGNITVGGYSAGKYFPSHPRSFKPTQSPTNPSSSRKSAILQLTDFQAPTRPSTNSPTTSSTPSHPTT